MKSFKQLGMIMPTAIGGSTGGNTGGGSSGSSGGSGGGGSVVGVSPKAVNFRDYDGTVLHSYTKDEALALTALPELPTRAGLICQEWNWSFEDMQSYVADYGVCEVGATYITDDGKTRLYITIAVEGRMDVPLYFQQTVENGVTIDWGDGSATETLSGTGNVNTSHTYASVGEHVISLDVADGCTLSLGHDTSNYCVMGSIGNRYCNMLQKVEVGNGVTSIESYAFSNCYSLVSIIIPNGVTIIDTNTFKACYSLASIIIPNGVTSIESYAFSNCYSLVSIIIPNGVKRIEAYAFYNCYFLASIVIPNSVTNIEKSVFNNCHSLASIIISNGVSLIKDAAFQACYSLASIVIPNSVTRIEGSPFISCSGVVFFDFSSHTAVPTLSSSNAFNKTPSDCEIRVPAALVDTWKAATNWSTYADNIVGV